MIDDEFPVIAEVRPTPALWAILAEGTQLLITIEDGVLEIPLAGAAEAGAPFFQACADQ